MRRLITLVLLCAFVLPFIPSCAVLTPGSTTQPVYADQVAAALKVYDYWRARVELLAKLAQGPNPSPKDVENYNTAIWWLDVARQALVIMGAPVPADTNPPKMIAGK